MQKSVKEDRDKYIGGSDIPIIMGISPFKERFALLLEKANLKENDFNGNAYTEYGNVMEPKIRDYINKTLERNFKEGKHIEGDIRCHTDGEDDTAILEIKTTSRVQVNVDDYKEYLVQLLFYMEHTNRKTGYLAVYNRPDDFNEYFDEKKLQLFVVNIENYKELIEQINLAVDQFRIDLATIKENPLITEEELVPTDLIKLSNKVLQLEEELSAFKVIQDKCDKARAQLKKAMENRGIKKWTTPNGTQITLVFDNPDKVIEEEYYNEEKFMNENAELYQQYHNKLEEYKETRTVTKKGKKGCVKITLPALKKQEK